MTILSEPPQKAAIQIRPIDRKELRKQHLSRTIVKWMTSTDHKTIGYLYIITSMVIISSSWAASWRC